MILESQARTRSRGLILGLELGDYYFIIPTNHQQHPITVGFEQLLTGSRYNNCRIKLSTFAPRDQYVIARKKILISSPEILERLERGELLAPEMIAHLINNR